jgi:hypothetical protein
VTASARSQETIPKPGNRHRSSLLHNWLRAFRATSVT